MKKVTLASFSICFVLFLMIWNTPLVHTETAAPSAGYTLASGEASCATSGCHTGSEEVLDTTKMNFKSVATPSISSGYQPNAIYNLYINMGLVQQLKKGFQITAVDQNGNGAGEFTLTSTTLTSKTTSGTRQYVGHKNASSTSSWTFKWQAPATDIGPVTFFYTGVGGNNDNQAGGDVVYRGRAIATTSSFSQLVLTGIRPINADNVQSLNIFPNPFSNKLNVEFFLHDENRVTIELFDLNGSVVKQLDECVEMPGFHQRNFTFEGKMTPGIYLLRITEGEKTYFKKLVAE